MSQSAAVVTGASQGIGRGTAVRLARDFTAVALVARRRAPLEHWVPLHDMSRPASRAMASRRKLRNRWRFSYRQASPG